MDGFVGFTAEQKRIVICLESLIHKRFNEEQLNKELSHTFYGEKLTFDYDSNRDDVSDWVMSFNSEGEKTIGYFDIYYLKMKQAGFNEETMYITEINYQFK